MSTELEHDERRKRRRRALLWLCAFCVAGLLVVLAGVFLRDAFTSGPVAEDGTGSAPVLGAPPPGFPPIGPAPTITAPDGSVSETPGMTSSTTGPPPTSTSPGDVPGSTPSGPGAPSGGTTSSPTVAPTTAPPEHPNGHPLVLTSTLSAPLQPGVKRTLDVSVRNPNSFAVQLYRLDVAVGTPPAGGCRPWWVSTGNYRYDGTSTLQIPPRSTIVVPLSIELVNLGTVNQNACRATTFPLSLSGLGVAR